MIVTLLREAVGLTRFLRKPKSNGYYNKITQLHLISDIKDIEAKRTNT